jgi:predicted secreted protein
MSSRGTDTPAENNPEAPALARLRREAAVLTGSAAFDVDAPEIAACDGEELRVAKTSAIRRKAETSDEGLLAPDEDASMSCRAIQPVSRQQRSK